MYSKEDQIKSNRIKKTQRQKGDISLKVRQEVKTRSNGACEVCDMQRATEMAHVISRVRIEHKTTADDILHTCYECHKWLDESIHGAAYKEGIRTDRERTRRMEGMK
jgi:hypothetical protein